MVATALIRGRGVSGEAEWRRWLHRGTEQRRERAVAEKEEVQGVKEAKFLEGEGKKSLGLKKRMQLGQDQLRLRESKGVEGFVSIFE